MSCFGDAKLNNFTSQCDVNLDCNTTSSCTICPNSHALNDKKQCLKCNYTDINCIACMPNGLDSCVKCASTFYLSNKTCIKCETPCHTCVENGVCLSCASGYYFIAGTASVSGVCKKCDNNCLTCTKNANQCTSC